MTVFKSFLKVARRNIGSVAIYVIIMLVMSFIMLSYLGDTSGDLQVSTSDYKVAVINGDGEDPLTQGLLSFLGSRAQLVPLEVARGAAAGLGPGHPRRGTREHRPGAAPGIAQGEGTLGQGPEESAGA